MTMVEMVQLNYNFKKPSQWDDFMAFSRTVTVPELPSLEQTNATQKIWDYAEQAMDVEEQERVRYYGLGLGVCGLMRVVMSESGRTEFVEKAVDVIVANHATYAKSIGEPPDQGLFLREADGVPFAGAALEFAQEPYVSQPLHQRIGVNVLHAMSSISPDYRPVMRDVTLQYLNNHKIDPALANLALSTLEGAGLVYQAALQHLYERQTGKSENEANPPIRQIADEATIQELDLTRVAPIAAGLRLDEMLTSLQDYVASDEDGKIYIDRQRIPAQPNKESSLKGFEGVVPLVHKARIRCPALYIPGANRFVINIMPQIINGAQRELLP